MTTGITNDRNPSSVQTRYSFYEAHDHEDCTRNSPIEVIKKLEENDSIDSMETHENSMKRTDIFQDSSSKDDPILDPNKVEDEEKIAEPESADVKVLPNEEASSHEKAIHNALSFIRKRSMECDDLLRDYNKKLSSITNMEETVRPLISNAVANATKLDSRMLSPPSDVRKSNMDMFRRSIQEEDDSHERHELLTRAQPLLSDGTSGGSSWNVVPSSPAPGKFNLSTSESNKKPSLDASVELLEYRRQLLEQERKLKYELELGKSVEKILLAVLEKGQTLDSLEDALSTAFASVTIANVNSVNRNLIPSLDNARNSQSLLDRSGNEPKEMLSESDSDESDSNIDIESGHDLSPSVHLEQMGLETMNSNDDNNELFDLNLPIEDEEEDFEDVSPMVLGRLSKKGGGTTGIVLDDGDDECDDKSGSYVNQTSPLCAGSILSDSAEDTVSPSIASSILSTVRKTSSTLREKISFSTKNSVDSYSPKLLQGGAAILCTLYRHILVRHPNQKRQKVLRGADNKETFSDWVSNKFALPPLPTEEVFRWDENDPDEPGYILHKFTKQRLLEIEDLYSDMMESYEEEYCSIYGPMNRKSDLERDIHEAEKYLNQKAKKEDVVTKVDNSLKSNKTPHTDYLATNPNFPGVKAAGEGNIGDLEMYHLPIIYKAHQTGFEASKDLVLLPDTVFAGQFYVQSELGSAAFSTAYRCVDLNSGKNSDDGEVYYDEVCLKVIKNTKDFFDQSLDEIKILELLRQTGQCNDNNILEMKTFFYHKEHLIIVTELLRQNLFEFGKYIMDHEEPQYFTRSRLCYIARQCLVALRFVHNLGLVHSDIKPENILLSSYSRARVKVIDFGSSCYVTDRQSSYIQSRSYRAPEVILGLPYDGKIDVWSLGCVVAEMYTGQVTFQNDSVVSMLSRIEAICGAFPRHMIDNGRQSGLFFTPTGLLYEKVEIDDDNVSDPDASASYEDESNEECPFRVFQPKTTTMAERLGFDSDLMHRNRRTWEEDEKALFVDFVTKLLTIDPAKRPTAEEALEHPWILSGFNLTEDDLRYPPE